ncbi:hypothetical protein ACFLSU_08590 [Bacteroidota bacterium]
MKINIFDSRISIDNIDDNEVFFNEDDLHPSIPFFINNSILIPESADEVCIKGLLEHSVFIRHILKIADSLLKEEGVLKVEFFNFSFDTLSAPYRGYTGIMHEISICFKERLQLIKKEEVNGVFILSFKKIKNFLPPNDNINSWSFGLVSDGRKNEEVLAIIESIINFNIPNFEILICGPSPSDKLAENIKILDDKDLYFDIRVPISKKKNRIIQNAKYNNLVIFHDRFFFPKDWFDKVKIYGNYFDGICPKIIDIETKSNRVQDWITTSLNHLQFKKMFPKKNVLEYNEWKPNWNLNGGHMIIKKHLIERVLLNPFLNWGEAEDGDMCRRLDADGFCLNNYSDLIIYTSTNRLKQGVNKKGISKYLQIIKYKLSLILNFYKRKQTFKQYLKDA